MIAWRRAIPEKGLRTSEILIFSDSNHTHEITSIERFLPDKEVTECITIRTKAVGSSIYFSMDRTVFSYDPGLQSIPFFKDFDSAVEDFSINESASLLVIGHKNGRVICFSTKEKKILKQWQVERVGSETTFLELHAGANGLFVWVGRGKKIYRAIIPSLVGSSLDACKDVEFECILNLESEVFSTCFSQQADKSFNIYFGGLSHLYIYRNDLLSKIVCSVERDVQVEKVLAYPDNSFILCLVEGKIMLFCGFTLICLKIFDRESRGELVLEFSLVINDEKEKQILLIMNDGHGKTALELIDINGFTSQFKIQVKYATLVDSPYHMDTLFFLEMVVGEETKKNVVSSINLKRIAESSPTDRLNHLLRKGLHEEAVDYASKHGLDDQQIYTAQFHKYVHMLQEKDSAPSFDHSHLESLIGKIDDIEFVIDSIFNMASLNPSIMKSLLSICLEKIDLVAAQTDKNLNTALKHVGERLQLLDTFFLLWPNDSEKWEPYVRTSILETFRKSLDNEAWLEAWVIWERHWKQCLLKFNSFEEIIIILDKLIHKSVSKEIYAILKSIITRVVLNVSNACNEITKWAISRIRYFESHKNWPEVALVFAENIYSYLDQDKAIENEILLTMDLFTNGLSYNWDSLQILHAVIESLKDIKYFKTEFGIEIRLSDQNMEEKDHLIHVLLLKIQNISDYGKIISSFIIKYASKHELHLDSVIERVIKDLISLTSWPNELEEEVRKAVALTGFIKDAMIKGRCTLDLMKLAPVPWEEELAHLVNEGMSITQSAPNQQNQSIAESITLQLNIMNALVTLKKYNLECCHAIQDFQMIITHIISVGKNEMMEDCLSLATTETKKEQVYVLCSDSYIRQRDYDRAFNLWNSLPKKTCISVLKRIVYNVHAASLIQGFENTDISYINNLKLLEMYLAEVLKDSDEGEYIIEDIPLKKLKGDYFVKKYVDSESVVDNVWQNASQLNKSVSRFASQSYANMSESDLLLQMKKSSEILDCGVEDILINMLVNFNKEDDDALSMTMITKLLLSVQGEGKVHVSGCLLDWILSSLLSSSLNEDCARNIQAYLWKTLTVCNPGDRPFYLELCRFLKLWFPHFGGGKIHGTAHLLPMQCTLMQASHGGLPPNDLLLSAIILQKHRQYWLSLFLQVHPYEGFEEATTMSITFSDSLREYMRNTSLWVSNQAVSIIAWCKALWSDDIDLMSISTCNLLNRLTIHKDMNVAVMIGLISGHKKSMVIDWLNTCINRSQGDLFKTWTLASMGEIFCDLYGLDKLAYSYADMSWKCIVAKRLKEMGMICGGTDGESFRISEDELLRRIMSRKHISVADVEEICFLCRLDTEKILLKYMEHLLLSWTPKYSVKVLLNGHEEIVILNTVDEINKVVCFICPLISPENLSKYLYSLWEKVNYYHYEIYDTILKILLNNNFMPSFCLKQKNMLRFLENYKRVSQPSSVEFSIYDEVENLPEIARWRLPLLTNNFKDVEEVLPSQIAHLTVASRIVDSEVNFQNYITWLKAPQIDHLDAKNICSIAIKHGIKVYLSDVKYVKEWQICPTKEVFIKNVQKCVMLIPDLKYATAAMNYISTKLPPGVDQLIAMEICLSLAQLWKKSADHADEAQDVLEKVKSRYLILSVKNILYKNGFGVPKYVEMIDDPIKLISRLYYDVTHFDSSIVVQKGGLNSVAEQIAELFSIDLEKLKLNLISKWISSKEEGAYSLDMTCVGEMFAKEGSLNTATFNEEIRRLLLICKSMPEEVVLAHVSSILLSSLISSVGLKIALCIREVQGSHALAAMLGLNESFSPGVYFTKLYHLLQLEGLGLINSPQECESMGSRILVENILSKKPSHQISIFLAAKLCLSSSVFDLSLWSHILYEMVKLTMFKELTQLLPLLRSHTAFLALQTYRDAWKAVVEAPFHVVRNSWTHEDEQRCFSSLQLLHLCPFLVDIDMKGIAEKCLKAGRVEMASLLLPYLPENQKITLKNMLKMYGSPEDVTRRVQSLPQALQVYCHQVFTILSSNSA